MATHKEVRDQFERSFEGEPWFLGAAVQRIPDKGLAVVVNLGELVDMVVGDDIAGIPVLVKVAGRLIDFTAARKVKEKLDKTCEGRVYTALTVDGPSVLVVTYCDDPPLPTDIDGIPIMTQPAGG